MARLFTGDGPRGELGQAFAPFATDTRTERLTEDMTQAFYRRELETIEMLAKQGAAFTPEMLNVAVGFRDQYLVRLCLDNDVVPDAKTICQAVDTKSAPLVAMLLAGHVMTKKVAEHIDRHGTEDMKKIVRAHNKTELVS